MGFNLYIDSIKLFILTFNASGTELPPLSLNIYSSVTAPVVLYDTPPSPVREVVTYSKEVQTIEEWMPSENSVEGSSEIRRPMSKHSDEQVREQIRKEIEEELKTIQHNITKPGDGKAAAGVGTTGGFFVRELSQEEKAAITASEDFVEFIERSSKVVERALDLDLEYDILADYGQGMNGQEDGAAGGRVKEIGQFYDERWSKKRMISDMNFSQKVRRPYPRPPLHTTLT